MGQCQIRTDRLPGYYLLLRSQAENISQKPFDNRFTSFAWEFACLIRSRLCYLDALKTGEFNFTDREGIPNKEELVKNSKSEMLNLLSTTSTALLSEIAQIGTQDKVATIIWLLQHERIHHGKLMLYFSKADLEIPDSFKKTWGETNFKKPATLK